MIVRGCFAGLLLSLVLTQPARADEAATLKKIEAANASAMAAYKAGDADRAKDQLLEAIVLGKESGLEAHAVMARVYLHLGAVQAEGLKDEEKAKRYFNLAVRIQPDIKASGDAGHAGVWCARSSAPVRRPGRPRRRHHRLRRAPARRTAPAPSRPQTEAAQARAREKMATAVLQEKEREARENALKAREERERLGKDLAALQEREKKEREGREKLEGEKQGLEKQLADAKDREKKEREEKDRLQKLNQDLEKQLIEARDKEKKEREIQRAAADRAARTGRRGPARRRQARDKLAEGPDVPSSIPQPIFCPTRDEWAPGDDVFIHCAPQSQVKAKELALYYRPSGAVHYNSLLMERSKKGWYVATIPGARVSGRMLQYYVEARGAKGEVAAANGKANSPNVMMIRPGASAELSAATTGQLTSASSTSTAPSKSRSGRRERAKKR